MEAHTNVDGDCGERGSSCSLSIASYEGVPDEGFKGRVCKMKSWMSGGDVPCRSSHCLLGFC